MDSLFGVCCLAGKLAQLVCLKNAKKRLKRKWDVYRNNSQWICAIEFLCFSKTKLRSAQWLLQWVASYKTSRSFWHNGSVLEGRTDKKSTVLLAVSMHAGASHRQKAGGENCVGNACECKFGELVHREAFGCRSNATEEPCCTYECQRTTLNHEFFVWTNDFISTSSKSIGIAIACLCRYMRWASPLVLRGLYTRFDDSIMSLM